MTSTIQWGEQAVEVGLKEQALSQSLNSFSPQRRWGPSGLVRYGRNDWNATLQLRLGWCSQTSVQSELVQCSTSWSVLMVHLHCGSHLFLWIWRWKRLARQQAPPEPAHVMTPAAVVGVGAALSCNSDCPQFRIGHYSLRQLAPQWKCASY